MKKTVSTLIGLAALLGGSLLWNSDLGQLFTGRWSFTDSIRNDRGTYFRFQVKVAYKGEPVDFDIVVGCNIRLARYKDGSNTTEVGMVPAAFGKRLPDNKGLVVRTPDACGSTYLKEGWIPSDLLPLIAVFDNADTLAFGTAYLSEESYQSPLSVLQFKGATITAAKRSEFENSRRREKNLVSRSAYFSGTMDTVQLAKRGLDLTIPFGGTCTAYQRFRVPEELRERVRQAWPAERPRYWWAGDAPLFSYVATRAQPDIGGVFRDLASWSDSSMNDRGIRKSSGGGNIAPPSLPRTPTTSPSFFPISSERRADQWPKKMEAWPAFIQKAAPFVAQNVEFQGGEKRGFAYCYNSAAGDPGSLDVAGQLRMQKLKADAMAVRRVDDTDISGAPIELGRDMFVFFEGDEFFFKLYRTSLSGDIGSDV